MREILPRRVSERERARVKDTGLNRETEARRQRGLRPKNKQAEYGHERNKLHE